MNEATHYGDGPAGTTLHVGKIEDCPGADCGPQAVSFRWVIRKGRSVDPTTRPDRPWQLWLVVGEVMGLKAERSRHAFCVWTMNRLEREHRR